jgi:hypothetical protein
VIGLVSAAVTPVIVQEIMIPRKGAAPVGGLRYETLYYTVKRMKTLPHPVAPSAVTRGLGVTVLSGFVGAGKTSVVKHILRNAQGRRMISTVTSAPQDDVLEQSSLEAIDYYKQVVERAPGESLEARRAATLRFARLFMVPGMGHCAGGPGATHFSTATRDSTPPISDARHDMAVALRDWVEHGVAPETLVATRYVGQGNRAIEFR